MSVTVKFDPSVNSLQAQVIPNATLNNDGVMTKEQVAQLNAASGEIATEDVVITGTPGADGIKALYEQLPAQYRKNCNIFLPAGLYTESQLLSLAVPTGTGPDQTDFGLIGELVVAEDGTETAGDANGIVATDAGLAMTVDAFMGQTLTFTSGANAGLSRSIASNTATAVTVGLPFPNAIGIGDTWEVKEPGTIIQHSGMTFSGPGAMFMKGIKFTSNVDDVVFITGEFFVNGESMEIDCQGATNFFVVHKAEFLNNDSNNPNVDGGSLADWYIHDATVIIFDCCFIPIGFNNNIFKNTSMFVFGRAQYATHTVFAKNFDISLVDNSSFGHNGVALHPSSIDGDNGSGYIISASKGSNVGVGGIAGNFPLRNIDLSNSSGDAILVQDQSYAALGTVSGTGNTGFGLNAINIAAARGNQGGATTVTGSADFQCGATPGTWAGASVVDVVGTLCVVQTA